MFFAVGITGAAGIWAFVVMLRQLYFICQPSEVLIFAGLSRTTGDGRKVATAPCAVAVPCASQSWKT